MSYNAEDIVWEAVDFHRFAGDRSAAVLVEDDVDSVPRGDNRPRVVFVPTVDGEPLGTRRSDPPIYPSDFVYKSFIATFGEYFGDPLCVAARGPIRGHARLIPYVVYALSRPDAPDGQRLTYLGARCSRCHGEKKYRQLGHEFNCDCQ